MSNSNRVSVDKLDYEIMKYLQEYKEDIEDDVKEASNKVIKKAKNELKQISPRTKKTVKLRGGTTVEPRKLRKVLGY